MDVICKPSNGTTIEKEFKSPGTVFKLFGGVGRNIAEVIARSKIGRTVFVSAVGDDLQASALIAACKSLDIDTTYLLMCPGARSPSYVAILDHSGEVHAAISDFEVVSSFLPIHLSSKLELVLKESKVCVLDANMTSETIAHVVEKAFLFNVPVIFEPTSVAKCTRILESLKQGKIWCLTPNTLEFVTICKNLAPSLEEHLSSKLFSDQKALKIVCSFLFSKFPLTHLIIKMGKNGAALASNPNASSFKSPSIPAKLANPEDLYLTFFAAPSIPHIVSTSGAGDSFVGGLVASLVSGRSILESIPYAIVAASLTLQSEHSVSPFITPTIFRTQP